MKLPHLMTQAEYLEVGTEYVKEVTGGTYVAYLSKPGYVARRPWSVTGHRFHIRQALAAGITVPPEVLADYPDLNNG